MDIGNVIKALRNGGFVRRSSWAEDIKLLLPPGKGLIMILHPQLGQATWSPSVDDILADDWGLAL